MHAENVGQPRSLERTGPAATDRLVVELRGYTVRRLQAASSEANKGFDELICGGLTGQGLGFLREAPDPGAEPASERRLCGARHVAKDGTEVACRLRAFPHPGRPHRWWGRERPDVEWP